MVEAFKLTFKEAREIVLGVYPEGFRKAVVNDFHCGGIRHQNVKIFILQAGNPHRTELVEYWFGDHTDKCWLVWLLKNNKVFIKTGNQVGRQKMFNIFLIPTDEFMNVQR